MGRGALIKGGVKARNRRILQVLLSLLLVAAIFYVVSARVDLAQVWADIQAMTWIELATISAIALWNFMTYWALWVAALPGLSFGRAMVVTQSGTMVTNTVPGGFRDWRRLGVCHVRFLGISSIAEHDCRACHPPGHGRPIHTRRCGGRRCCPDRRIGHGRRSPVGGRRGCADLSFSYVAVARPYPRAGLFRLASAAGSARRCRAGSPAHRSGSAPNASLKDRDPYLVDTSGGRRVRPRR